ncbi:MAG: GNAT family N-acetyltransferase [Bacteroidetes bacterium]|nr:GNAT family N-acetyltransferase [Bacteroidota bacterium]
MFQKLSASSGYAAQKCPVTGLVLAAQGFVVRTLDAVRMKRTAPDSDTDTYTAPLPSGLRADLFLHIARVPASHWDSLIKPDQFFLTRSFLQVTEETASPGLSFIYALIYKDDVPFTALYFQVVHLSADHMAGILAPLAVAKPLPGIGSNWSEWLRRCREENGLRLLISGNNFVSGEYGIAFQNDTDKPLAFTALAETVKHITKTFTSPVKISAVLVKDYYQHGAAKDLRHLSRYRYHKFSVEPEMIVPLRSEWKNFDDYMGAMVKKYRTRTRSVLSKTAALQVEELNSTNLTAEIDQLYALYTQVNSRARFRLTKLTAGYFVQMKTAFPDFFRIHVYRLHGKPVAFRTSFLLPGAQGQKPALEAHFIGLDYAVNNELHLYQRLLYDFVREGIDAGARQIFLGRTAPEIKSTVGAQAYELTCCIRHRNGFSNQIIRPFIDYLKPSSWVPRNPFGETV